MYFKADKCDVYFDENRFRIWFHDIDGIPHWYISPSFYL